jgi:hypothetical protein
MAFAQHRRTLSLLPFLRDHPGGLLALTDQCPHGCALPARTGRHDGDPGLFLRPIGAFRLAALAAQLGGPAGISAAAGRSGHSRGRGRKVRGTCSSRRARWRLVARSPGRSTRGRCRPVCPQGDCKLQPGSRLTCGGSHDASLRSSAEPGIGRRQVGSWDSSRRLGLIYHRVVDRSLAGQRHAAGQGLAGEDRLPDRWPGGCHVAGRALVDEGHAPG